MADELALRATVAFAKRVESVDFAEVVSEALGEFADAEAFEVIFLSEFGEDALCFGFDSEMAAEEIAFYNINSTDFAGPIVEVLEEVLVDGLEMSEIEIAVNGRI